MDRSQMTGASPNARRPSYPVAAYLFYARLRLVWFALASGRILLRYWIWLLAAGLLFPGIPVLALPALLVQALVALVTLQPAAGVTFAALAALQIAALLWLAPQRRNILGGTFQDFAATLPLPRGVRRLVDLTMLALLDVLFTVLVAGAMADRLAAGSVAQALVLAVMLASLVVAQLAVLERRPAALAFIGVADAMLALLLTPGGMAFSGPLLLLASLALALALLPERRRAIRPKVFAAAAGSPQRGAMISPAFGIQLKALAAHPTGTLMRLALTLAIATGAVALDAAFHFDGRALPVAIVGLAGSALVLAGLYRTLREAHAPMRAFLATLPLARAYWPIRDIALLTALGAVPLAIELGWLGIHQVLPLLVALALAVAYAMLLALLRLPLRRSGPLGALLGLLIASGWAGTAIAAVVR